MRALDSSGLCHVSNATYGYRQSFGMAWIDGSLVVSRYVIGE